MKSSELLRDVLRNSKFETVCSLQVFAQSFGGLLDQGVLSELYAAVSADKSRAFDFALLTTTCNALDQARTLEVGATMNSECSSLHSLCINLECMLEQSKMDLQNYEKKAVQRQLHSSIN